MDYTFTKATKRKVKARFAIDGPSGSGKTYTALVAATVLAEGGKIAVIDTEHGSASLYSDIFTFDVLELDNFNPENYTNAIQAAEKAGYAVIVVDSLSHAWEGEGGALDMADDATRRMKNPNSYVAWKEVTPIHRKMVEAMLGSPAHIVATMRSKMEYVQDKDSNGKPVIRKVGMAPIQRQGMEYEFTLVGDMDIDHTIVISKSRCPALADAVEKKPGKDFFKRFLDWLNSGAPEAPAAPLPTKQKPEPAPTPETEQKQPLSLEEAYKIKNRDGLEYGNIATETLQVMLLGIRKALNNPDVSADDRMEYLKKQSAINLIIAARKSGEV
jgi:hypothetical protein